MHWKNVKLIWFREVRDQLRDRRTIFTIAVLPLLLYPVLGMSVLKVTEFMQQHPTRVWLIGNAALPNNPSLLDNEHFAKKFSSSEERRLLEVDLSAKLPEMSESDGLDPRLVAERKIRDDVYDVVVFFPPNFAERLASFQRRLKERTAIDEWKSDDLELQVPRPEIFVNMASDKSRIAYDRVDRILARWRRAIVRMNLETSNVPMAATEPFELSRTDISEATHRRAAVWSKVLPFIVLIWALTGAFYPAIDICAGEKERGTLETLLSSPAARSDIVGGKLLTVMSFSGATAVLNLASMGATGAFIANQIQGVAEINIGVDLTMPPLTAIFWLLLALIPISALFSALTLAIAAFARSTKEGQYYLMPLLLVTLPLMMLPMMPTAELGLGMAVIPVTGMMLWLRALIEGQYAEALRYAAPVLGVTAICCWLSVRWAIRQFNDESVLFRESERFSLAAWLRHVVRDRGATPSVAEALICGVVILLLTFFVSLRAVMPESWGDLVGIVLVPQICLIALPAVLMAFLLTRSPRRTLSLAAPRVWTIPAAFLLAVVLQPAVMWAGQGIQALYPLSEEAQAALLPIMKWMHDAPLLYVVLLVGLTPAICEELAFRGFILSGLRHAGSKWGAIVVSSLFFGMAHGMLQQSLAAAAIGVLIGYIAIQTGSLFPGMIFHFTHNSISVLAARVDTSLIKTYPSLDWIFEPIDQAASGYIYAWPMVIFSVLLAAGILACFRRLPYQRYAEEQLQEALDHQQPTPATAME